MKEDKEFTSKVYHLVKQIPPGKVLSYGEVARAVGRPRAWRAVGYILSKNKDSQIPCHRVIKSNQKVGGFRQGVRKKISLLKKEGIKIENRRVVSVPQSSRKGGVEIGR